MAVGSYVGSDTLGEHLFIFLRQFLTRFVFHLIVNSQKYKIFYRPTLSQVDVKSHDFYHVLVRGPGVCGDWRAELTSSS